ncbi:MAG TPA: type II CAAX endopeptidase family protein, partial [Nitriliruptorales bacterium]|nr:type II CAAX endopeptidase family protein [Nitriliruptorales bacterium]
DPAWPPRPPEWRHDAPDPPRAFAVPWTWRDGLALILIVLGTVVVLSIVAGVLGLDTRSDAAVLGFAVVSQAAVLTVAYGYLRGRDAWTWRLLGPVRPEPRHAAIGVGIGASGWLLVTATLVLLTTALDPEEVPRQETIERVAEGGPVTVLFGVLAAVLLAPLVEELIYRAVLFQALRARLGALPAIGISSFVWASMHLELFVDPEGTFRASGLIGVLGLVLLGFWLAGAFHRTGSLVVPVVGHAVFNAIALTLAVASGAA